MLKSKHKFLLLIMVVLLITGLCFGLIACKDPEPDPKPNPEPVVPTFPTSADIFKEALNKVAASYSVGTDFKIDIAANAEVRKKKSDGTTSTGNTFAEGDFAFELKVKANVKLGEKFADEDNFYLVELNDRVSGASIVQLYFETQSGENITTGNYLYASLFGSEVFKINAFSLKKLLADNNKVSATADLDINSVIDMVLGMAFGEIENQEDLDKIKVGDDYVFTIDINGIWSVIDMFVGNPETLKGLLGGILPPDFDVDAIFAGIDDAIAQMFPGLSLKNGTPVNNLKNLVAFVNENIPAFTTTLKINFDGDKFQNATFDMDMVPQPDTFSGYVVSAAVSKVDIAATPFAKADVLAGSFIEKNYTKDGAAIDSRFEAPAINLVNFNYTTTVQFLDAEKKVVRDMDIRINADINPFSIIGGITKESIMAMGSFSIEIQNVNNGPYQLAIHYDPAQSGDDSVYFYIALATNNADTTDNSTMVLASQLSISNVIASLTDDIGYVFPGIATTAEGGTDIGGILDTVGKLLNAFTFSADDVTITVDPIFEALNNAIQLAGIDLSGLLLGNGTEYIRVAGGTFTYGDAQPVVFNPNKWVAESLKNKISNGTTAGKYVDSSTIEIDDIVQVPYGTPFNQLFQANDSGVFAGVSYEYIGSDDKINATMLIQKALGYNPNKVGKQKVMLQGSVNSDLSLIAALVDIPNVNLMNILSNVPIVVEIEVLPPDDAISAKVNGTTELAVGESILGKLDAKIITHDATNKEIEFALNKYMIKAASMGVNTSNFTASKAGKQWIEVELANGTTRINFNVAGVEFRGIAVIGGNITDALKAELMYVDAEGAPKTRVLGKADITQINVDGTEYAKVNSDGELTKTGAGNVIDIKSEKLTIVNSDNNLKKTIEIIYKYETGNAKKEVVSVSNRIMISKEGNGTAVTANSVVGGSLKINSTLDGALSIDIYKDSKVLAANYRVVWLPFEGKNADGEIVYDYSDTSYGIKGSSLLDPTNYTVSIVVKDNNGDDVTADVFRNGVFVKGGIYTITISGSITIGGEVYKFSADVVDLNGNTITVKDASNELNLNTGYIEKDGDGQLTLGKRMLSNAYGVKMEGVTLKNYVLHSINDAFAFNNGLVWNDTDKVYTVQPDAIRIKAAELIVNRLPINSTEKTNLMDTIKKGMTVKFYYSAADVAPEVNSENWTALCDENGYVTTGGAIWIKVVAEFEGQEISSVTNRKINVSYGTATVTDSVSQDKGVYTYYTGQKITFAEAEYFVAGVSKKVVVTGEMLSVVSGSAEKLSTDGFIRFTAEGTYTVNVAVAEGYIIPVQFKVVAPGLEANNIKDTASTDYSFFGVDADIYEIMAKAGWYKQYAVDETGNLTSGNATAEDIRKADPIGTSIFVMTEGIKFVNGVITAVPAGDNKLTSIAFTQDLFTVITIKAGAGNVGDIAVKTPIKKSDLKIGDNVFDIIVANESIVGITAIDEKTGKATSEIKDKEWLKANLTLGGSSMGTIDSEGIILTDDGYGMNMIVLVFNIKDYKGTITVGNQ